MWEFENMYQLSKQNKSDLKFDDEFLSDYTLETKAKFQIPTSGFGEELP